jgi:leucyl aminopeptidase
MAIEDILVPAREGSLPLIPVQEADFSAYAAGQAAHVRAQMAAQRFEGRRYTHAVLYGTDGEPAAAVVGVRSLDDPWALGSLAFALPPRTFALASDVPAAAVERLALGYALGAYQYTRYKPKAERTPAALALADEDLRVRLQRIGAAAHAARDLVNTPTEDLGPEQLEDVVAELAASHGAHFRRIVGEDLLAQNFPAIHAVGRASHRAPRLLELVSGRESDPLLAIVGKGVCFDTGGLDLKPADGMALMKKDMGGAAVAIGLARLVLESRLPVRLLLLVPAVENALGPDAYRPGEVIATRAGLSVEIGNTDAEGRVILCDALSYAAEQAPALILDFATLTGAARIALGPDLPATFANRDDLSRDLVAAGRDAGDPLWPMPLWEDYYALIDSKIADLNNAGSSKMAGCITAALYLKRFVPDTIPWAHLDTYCWSEGKPGRPYGGDCQGLRAAFALLERRFGQ